MIVLYNDTSQLSKQIEYFNFVITYFELPQLDVKQIEKKVIMNFKKVVSMAVFKEVYGLKSNGFQR